MKKTFLLPMLAVVIAVLIWQWQSNSAKDPSLEQTSGSPTTKPLKSAGPSLPDQRVALEQQLAEEKTARFRAEQQLAETQQKLAEAEKLIEPMKREVVVALGTPEEIGGQTARMLKGWEALEALSRRDPATLTAAEKTQLLNLQRERAQTLGILPEIAGFQDRPAEYGRFFRRLLQDSAALNDTQAQTVEGFMRQRAVEMNALGLNQGRTPTDPALAAPWEQQRDAFNTATYEGITKLVPAEKLNSAGINASLLELLENDFTDFQRVPAQP